MTEDHPAPDSAPSPCIRICVIHPETRICTGCLRSIEEITAWPILAPADRRAILDALPARAPLLRQRRGGRGGRIRRSADPE